MGLTLQYIDFLFHFVCDMLDKILDNLIPEQRVEAINY